MEPLPAEALGRIGVAAELVVPGLRDQLGTRDHRLRGAVITSLGMLGEAASDAEAELEQIAAGSDKECAARAAVALRQIRRGQ